MSEKLPIEFIEYLDRRFDRLETQLDAAHQDVVDRVTELETQNAHRKGAIAMLSAISSAVGAVIVLVIQWVKS